MTNNQKVPTEKLHLGTENTFKHSMIITKNVPVIQNNTKSETCFLCDNNVIHKTIPEGMRSDSSHF